MFDADQLCFGINLALDCGNIIPVLLFGQIQLLLKRGLLFFQRGDQRFQLFVGRQKLALHCGKVIGDFGNIRLEGCHFRRIFGIEIADLEIQQLDVLLIDRLQNFKLGEVIRLLTLQTGDVVLQILRQRIDLVFEVLNLFEQGRLIRFLFRDRFPQRLFKSADPFIQRGRCRIQVSGEFLFLLEKGIDKSIHGFLQRIRIDSSLRIPNDHKKVFNGIIIRRGFACRVPADESFDEPGTAEGDCAVIAIGVPCHADRNGGFRDSCHIGTPGID